MPYWSITSTEIKMYHIPVMIGDNKNSYFFLNPHAGIFPSRQIDKTPPYYSIYKPMELRWKSHGIYKMIYYKMIYFNIYYKHKNENWLQSTYEKLLSTDPCLYSEVLCLPSWYGICISLSHAYTHAWLKCK